MFNNKSPFPSFTNIFERLVSPSELSPFNLRRLENFPFTEWSAMQAHYEPLVSWFNGEPLKEVIIVDKASGETAYKYPIQMNPIPRTCEKHAAVLLGNTLESIREGGLPIQFVPKRDVGSTNGSETEVDGEDSESLTARPAQEKNEAGDILADAIRKSFECAGGGAMFADAAYSSQFMGGSVWRVRFDDKNVDYPIQVETIDCTEFLGIPKGGNHWDFHEVWFVREISIYDAEEYGYTWNKMDEKFYYLEHWTPDTLEVLVNDKTIRKEGNPFGVVPFVYIPHVRVRSFLGKSIITESVKGIIKEWNLRFGDVGDAVSDDSHPIVATRGVRGNLGEVKLSDGRKVVNLGSKTGLSNNETDPDLFAVKTQVASEPMIKLNQVLEGQYRKETNHPAVADGEDEGSQRSAATLTVRMWPLISHVEIERINWTVGMLKLAKIILKMYFVKGLGGITEEMVNAGFTIKWSSSLPRDREALINELAIRRKNKMTSLRHTLELLGDIEDIDMEIAMIEEEDAAQQERQMALMEARGNIQGKNNQEKGDKTNTDAKNQLKKEQ